MEENIILDAKHPWLIRGFVNPDGKEDQREYAEHLCFHYATDARIKRVGTGKKYPTQGIPLYLETHEMGIKEDLELFRPFDDLVKDPEIIWPRYNFDVEFYVMPGFVKNKTREVLMKTYFEDGGFVKFDSGGLTPDSKCRKNYEIGRKNKLIFYQFENIPETTMLEIMSIFGSTLRGMHFREREMVKKNLEFPTDALRPMKSKFMFNKSRIQYNEGDVDHSIPLNGHSIKVIYPRLKALKALFPNSSNYQLCFRELRALRNFDIADDLGDLPTVYSNLKRRYEEKLKKLESKTKKRK
jgi:hypothetical protein